jgi:putative oxidoreductase
MPFRGDAYATKTIEHDERSDPDHSSPDSGSRVFCAWCTKDARLVWRYGFSATMASFTQMGIPALFAFLAIAAEFFGGLGLLVGLLGRVADFGVLCNMLVAIVMIYGHMGFFMNWTGTQKSEGYEYHLLAIALCVAILVKGSGALSIDRALTGSRPPNVLEMGTSTARRAKSA